MSCLVCFHLLALICPFPYESQPAEEVKFCSLLNPFPVQVELSQLQRTTYRSILERNFDWLNRGQRRFFLCIFACLFHHAARLRHCRLLHVLPKD
jgi:hypothetical protein